MLQKPCNQASFKNACSYKARLTCESCELQDQENLDEAREISAFMRRKRSGDIKFLDEELKNDMHSLQVHISSTATSFWQPGMGPCAAFLGQRAW